LGGNLGKFRKGQTLALEMVREQLAIFLAEAEKIRPAILITV